MNIDLPDEYYTLEDLILIAMEKTGWSREKAALHILEAMLRGDLPYMVDGVEPPSTGTKH